MGSIAKFRKKQVGILAAAVMASVYAPTAFALPQDPHNIKGDLEIRNGENTVGEHGAISGNQLKVTLKSGQKGAIDWDSFNIDKDQNVHFSGPAGWMILNRVDGNDATKIFGTGVDGKGALTGDKNGTIFLVNPNGITFGEGASVDVGSFVASTLDISQDDFMQAGSSYNFKGDSKAQIVNLANITAADDGVVALLAHQVVSGGTITTGEDGSFKDAARMGNMNSINAGQVVMAAGKDITLDLKYDDKIGVKINKSFANYDFVINASNVTGKQGYVLMKAGDAREIGTHLVCQTGIVTANQMTKDKGGNIILQAENVNAGGTLTAEGKDAKIGIYGNSLVSAKASAADEGGVIDIDTMEYAEGAREGGANIALAGAELLAGKQINTRSNHSVVVFNDLNGKTTTVKAESNGTAGAWNIEASKVKIDNLSGEGLSDVTKDGYDLQSLENLKKDAYVVSNAVVGKTLETTNVNIKTGQYKGHYVFSEQNIQDLPGDEALHDANGDNNIEVNADIKKTGGKETSLTMTAFKNTDGIKNECTGEVAKDGKIVLNADIKSETAPLNVELTATNIDLDKIRSDKTVKISTPGSHEHGHVTITGKVGSHTIAGAATGGSRNLIIEAGDTKIEASEGGVGVNNLEIYAKGNIDVAGQVEACDKVIARANEKPLGNYYLDALYDTEGNPAYRENYNVTFHNDVKAGNTISLSADEDVTIEDTLKAKAVNNDRAVEIVAQRNFVGNMNDKPIVTAEGSSWKIYSTRPENDTLGKLYSNNYAGWGWGSNGMASYIPTEGENAAGEGNRFIFKHNPTLTYTPESVENKPFGTTIDGKNVNYTVKSDVSDAYKAYFYDADPEKRKAFEESPAVRVASTASEGYKAEAALPRYDIDMVNVPEEIYGYKTVTNQGAVTISVPVVRPPEGGNDPAPSVPGEPVNPAPAPAQPATTPAVPEVTPAEPSEPASLPGKPQIDHLDTTNLNGSASYTLAQKTQVAGVDRVLGLQSAELPFFNEKRGTVKLYGTYDVSVDPDKVTMEPTAKVLPEPDQEKNQYRELSTELATGNGTANFKLTYNGSTLDIYPTDAASMALLVAGDGKKNVEVESKALFEAFTNMGISLDDLDGVYTHFDSLQAGSFRN